MKPAFTIWAASRNIFADFFDGYSLEQLNKVPAGFNNNLIWNLGHIIAIQQALVYRLSNVPMLISNQLFDTYRTGSKPTGQITQKEVDELRVLWTSLVRQTEMDYVHGKFTSFKEITTTTGFHLTSLEQAIEFNNYHEGLHVGYMMNIRKFI